MSMTDTAEQHARRIAFENRGLPVPADYDAAHDDRGQCIAAAKHCIAAGHHRRPRPLAGPRLAPDGREHAWGPITAIHEVGDIQVVEYRRDTSNHSESQPWVWAEHGTTVYSPYVEGRATSRSYASLDSALVGAIAYKREGPNGQAAAYFERMTLPRD